MLQSKATNQLCSSSVASRSSVFSCRHQIAHLATHGYRVHALDLRWYGDSDFCRSPTSYTWCSRSHQSPTVLQPWSETIKFQIPSDDFSRANPNNVSGVTPSVCGIVSVLKCLPVDGLILKFSWLSN